MYETGAAIYIYFGFNYMNVKNPLPIFDKVEAAARDEIIKQGGCISHHHGIGRIRRASLIRSFRSRTRSFCAAPKSP